MVCIWHQDLILPLSDHDNFKTNIVTHITSFPRVHVTRTHTSKFRNKMFWVPKVFPFITTKTRLKREFDSVAIIRIAIYPHITSPSTIQQTSSLKTLLPQLITTPPIPPALPFCTLSRNVILKQILFAPFTAHTKYKSCYSAHDSLPNNKKHMHYSSYDDSLTQKYHTFSHANLPPWNKLFFRYV